MDELHTHLMCMCVYVHSLSMRFYLLVDTKKMQTMVTLQKTNGDEMK